MAVHCRLALLCGLGALIITHAAHAAPPFEKLSLRDALLARPEIIATLDLEARQQLAQRFETARKNPTEPLRTTVSDPLIAVEQMRAMDEARFAAHADAFIAGKLVSSPLGLEALPFSGDVSEPAEAMPIEWIATGTTAEAEQSALLGNAGAIIRRLMLTSESSRLVRVESWPIGVLAIDGTLYVNASWLVAMSPRVEPKSPEAAKPQAKAPKPSLEPGCGGAVITSSSEAPPASPRVTASEPPQAKDQETEKSATEHATTAPETQRTAGGGELPEVQKIFGDDTKAETTSPRPEKRTSSDEHVGGAVRAESLPPEQNYSYAGAGGFINPADCCRDQNACGGADSSCAATATVCADPNSTCNTTNCSSNTCNTGSCSTGSCSTGSCSTGSCDSGSSCSSDDKCNSSDSGCGSGSGCSSGSGGGSGSGCSGSSGGSSGSSCSGSSGGSSSSSCGSSGGGSSSSSCGSSGGGSGSSSCGSSGGGSSSSCGKCAVKPPAPPPVIRRRGDIPDVATFGILLLPLWYLVRQGRRRPQA